MPQTFQLRRGTAAEWLFANPILQAGELGYETDTRSVKAGNGVDRWSDLEYVAIRADIAAEDISSGTISDDRLSANVVLTTDSRLSDSREPTGSAGGDLSGTYPNPSLANTSVTPGTYGSGSSVATFTVDSDGRLTAAGNATIAVSTSNVSGLASVATSGAYGELTGLPTLGTAAATDATDYATAAQGALADSAVQPGDLAASATTDTTNASNITSGKLSYERLGDIGNAIVGDPDPITEPWAVDTIGGRLFSIAQNSRGLFDGIFMTRVSVGWPSTATEPTLRAINSGVGNSFEVWDEAGDETIFVVDGSGNLGINLHYQSSPSEALHVVGNGLFTGTVTSGGELLVKTNDSRLSDSRAPTSHASTHATGGSDAIAPADIGAAPAASPTFTGDVTIHDKIVHSGDSNTAIRFPAADTFTIETDGVERLRVRSDGNVGIGTAGNTGTRLSFGTFFVNSTAPASDELTSHIRLFESASGQYGFGVSSNALHIAANQNSGTIRLHTDGTERLRVDSSGRVGIGRTPSVTGTSLEVEQDIYQSLGRSVNFYNSNYGIGTPNSSGLQIYSGDSIRLGRRLSGTFTPLVLIDCSSTSTLGFVGIGTESPASRLDVNGVITVSAGSGSAGSYLPAVVFSGDPNTGIQQIGGADTFSIVTGGNERVRVRSDGNVGIGASGGTNAGLWVQPTLSSTSGRYGIYTRVVATAASNSSVYAVAAFADVQANGSPDNTVCFFAVRPSIATGASVGKSVGLLVDSNFSTATKNYGLQLQVPYGADNYCIYADGTAPSYFAGSVGIQTSDPTAKLDINADTMRLRTAKTPASASDTGNAGDICWDSSYLYICTATNTWRRIAHSTW